MARNEQRYKIIGRAIREQKKYVDSHYYGAYKNPEGVRNADLAYLAQLVAAQLTGVPVWGHRR